MTRSCRGSSKWKSCRVKNFFGSPEFRLNTVERMLPLPMPASSDTASLLSKGCTRRDRTRTETSSPCRFSKLGLYVSRFTGTLFVENNRCCAIGFLLLHLHALKPLHADHPTSVGAP